MRVLGLAEYPKIPCGVLNLMVLTVVMSDRVPLQIYWRNKGMQFVLHNTPKSHVVFKYNDNRLSFHVER